MNISNYSEVKDNFRKIYENHGRIDILVNSAGIVDDKRISFMTQKSWENVINTNLNGTFWAIKSACKFMVKNKGGVILNISSVVSNKATLGQSNYSSSKAGIEALTRNSALEFAKDNIRVNSISPGYVGTDMLSGVSNLEQIVEKIPLGRIGNVKDVSELALFSTVCQVPQGISLEKDLASLL